MMNGFSVSEVERSVLEMTRSGRMPHTVILQGSDPEALRKSALYLAAFAVCREKNAPCLECSACSKALSLKHPDIIIPALSGKTKIINIKSVREIIKDASVIPNEADTKVVLMENADKSLPSIAQNSLLKLIEEPPQSLLFIFTVKSVEALLPTVRSRAQVIMIAGEEVVDEKADEIAREIARSVVSLYEFDLLKVMTELSQKENKDLIPPALTAFCEYLRKALCFESGIKTEDETALILSGKLNREKLISLIEATQDAVGKAQTNINTALLCAWLCARYRRISWQK